jgi:hypothetical protein
MDFKNLTFILKRREYNIYTQMKIGPHSIYTFKMMGKFPKLLNFNQLFSSSIGSFCNLQASSPYSLALIEPTFGPLCGSDQYLQIGCL